MGFNSAFKGLKVKQETGLASEPVWAFWRGDNFNNNNNNYYYYYYYYNNSVLQCTLQCYVLQSRSTALQCYVLQSRSTALQCYVLQSRSTALQTPITVAISEVADPSGRAVCGYGYIGAKTDTTQQSGQTPDKEVEIKKNSTFCRHRVFTCFVWITEQKFIRRQNTYHSSL